MVRYQQRQQMDMDMGGPMMMVTWSSCQATFIWEELETGLDDCGAFAGACIATVIYCILHMLIHHSEIWIQQWLQGTHKYTVDTDHENQHAMHQDHDKYSYNASLKQRLIMTAWYFVYAFSNIIVMLLMMTMNWYVELSIAVGLAIGYFVFGSQKLKLNSPSPCHISN